MAGQIMTVRCRNVGGKLVEITWADHSEFVSPGSVLAKRIVVVSGKKYVRKFVSREAGERNPRLYDLLDNEVRACARFGQVFTDRYPAELPKLAGYNMDADEPFVLLQAYSGEPAAGPVSRFDNPHRQLFMVSLLRALQLTAAAGVVHGAVTMDSVRWDGDQVQLVDFEHAERVDEPRRAAGSIARSPARSPEQVAGTGEVDVRDDVWAAGLLIRELYLGPLAASLDRGGDPERLRTMLDPVFDNPVQRRPHPSDLLRRLRVDSQLPAMVDPNEGLAAGHRRFDQVCEAKRGGPTSDRPVDDRRRPAGWARQLLPFLGTTVVVAMVIIGIVVFG